MAGYQITAMFGVFLVVTAVLYKVGIRATKVLVPTSFFFTAALMSGQ